MSAPGPGEVMFAFVRHWSRRAGDPQAADNGRLVLVSEAVHSLGVREATATVNAIAAEIGIDQSGASRLVRNAIDAGYLTMRRSAADGRRREAALTPQGRALLRHAHRWQEQVFDRLADGWSPQRRREFQAAMEEIMTRSHTLGA